MRELEDLRDLEDLLEGLGGFEGAGPGSADLRAGTGGFEEPLRDLEGLGDLKEPGPEVQTTGNWRI